MSSYRRFVIVPAALVAALAVAPAALAVDYPPPNNPGQNTSKPKGPFRTLRVCKKGHSCFPRIQDAVNEARPGDTIRVAHGTWREGVKISGAKKRYIKLIGDPKNPAKVVLEGKGLKKAANGVMIVDAPHVTVDGFTAKHYNANGFFALRSDRYTFKDLRAFLVGVYGVYAFHTVGGTISDSVAAWNSDSGFYIGETPPQAKPVRSIVKNIESYGNVLGWSGTNMRYVTITDSKFYNNGAGLVPNALDSEKYPPAENNVITRNEIFWNNFDYYQGAPWKHRDTSVKGAVPFPVGVGVLLFGGRGNEVSQNKIYGNWLVGAGMLQALTLKDASAKDLQNNSIRDNDFGLGGTDLNGRDVFYDGNGSGNCVGPNTGVTTTYPTDGSTFQPCPFAGNNAFSSQAQADAVNWTVGDSTHEANWIRHDHAPKAGYTAFEHYQAGMAK